MLAQARLTLVQPPAIVAAVIDRVQIVAGEEVMPRQANLWACSGSGRWPSVWNSAIVSVLISRNPYDLLIAVVARE